MTRPPPSCGRSTAYWARLWPGRPTVTTNRVQLQQVILNLCINADEAMDSVTNRDRVLKVMSEQQSSDVSITVEGSGVCVEPKNIERIFEQFYTTKSDGMGMGLSICRSIIEEHGVACSRLQVACADWQYRFHCRPIIFRAPERTSGPRTHVHVSGSFRRKRPQEPITYIHPCLLLVRGTNKRLNRMAGVSRTAKTFTPKEGQYLAFIHLYPRLHGQPKPTCSNIFASAHLRFTRWC
jgi:Histidine kinase-, DNA gyrase B-, and HSP90-like ATPase